MDDDDSILEDIQTTITFLGGQGPMAILQENKKDVQVNGNFETSKFKIQASAKAFDILSKNIYKDPRRAIIRELSCNAHDSHVAAGTDRPFKVHLPTSLESWFSVRDYGTGLSDEDVRNIFTTYFCSTKTESNDYVGALGLGSKSPFAINDSFTVVSYLDGTKREYSCYKDPNGEPQISLLTQTETEEPNGLLVKVTVSETYGWKDRAVKVFKHFETMPIINSTDVVEDIEEDQDYFLSGDGFKLRSEYGSLHAVMGNVAYEISSHEDLNEYRNMLSNEGYLIFDIGDLSFDAGRENLTMDEHTVSSIKKRLAQVSETIGKEMFSNIQSQPTLFKQALMVDSYRSSRLYKHLKSIPSFNEDDYALPHSSQDVVLYGTDRYKRNCWKSSMEFVLPSKNTRYFLAKQGYITRLKNMLREQNTEERAYVLTEKQIAECKIDADVVEDLADLPKVERRGTSGGICKVKTFVYRNTNRWRMKDMWDVEEEYDTEVEKVYVEISRWDAVKYSSIENTMSHINNGFGKVVKLYGLKSAFLNSKSFREHNWIELRDWVSREAESEAKNILKEPRNVKWYLFEHLVEESKNSELGDIMDLYEDIKDQRNVAAFYQHFSLRYVESDSLVKKVKDFFDKHPMLKYTMVHDYSDETVQDLINYINRGETE